MKQKLLLVAACCYLLAVDRWLLAVDPPLNLLPGADAGTVRTALLAKLLWFVAI